MTHTSLRSGSSCQVLTDTQASPSRQGRSHGSVKREKRRKERKWRNEKSVVAWEDCKNVKNCYNDLLCNSKRNYDHTKILEAGSDMSKLYLLFNSLTGTTLRKKLPDGFCDNDLADNFFNFFKNKIMNIVSGFVNMPFMPVVADIDVDCRLQGFKSITKDDLARVFKKAKKTYCADDPMPVLDIIDADNFSSFMDMVLSIVNTSILSCKFPDSEK